MLALGRIDGIEDACSRDHGRVVQCVWRVVLGAHQVVCDSSESSLCERLMEYKVDRVIQRAVYKKARSTVPARRLLPQGSVVVRSFAASSKMMEADAVLIRIRNVVLM